MKNNKGFTLIELLTMIIILAIIAAVILPKVTKIVEKAKMDSATLSAQGYIEDVEAYYMKNSKSDMNSNFDLDGEYNIENGHLKSGNEDHDIISKKTAPSSGFLIINQGDVLDGCITIGDYKVVFLDEKVSSTEKGECLEINKEYTFDYTGGEQNFIIPQSGYYKLEVWGAQGGSSTDYSGGYGGYSIGVMHFNKNDTLYINVGGQGDFDSNVVSGGYNGGGEGYGYEMPVGSGGGATHISTASGLLSTLSNNKNSVVIVAGGGGGAYDEKSSVFGNTSYGKGGSGGGYIGGDSSDTITPRTYKDIATGGTQTSGGTFGKYYNSTYPGLGDVSNGAFGQGGYHSDTGSDRNIPGGGGGFYGGAATVQGSASGGSGYIGNSNLKDKSMYCYECEESSSSSKKTISTTGTSTLKDTINCPSGYNSGPVSKCAKVGNGYAKITFLGVKDKSNTVTLDRNPNKTYSSDRSLYVVNGVNFADVVEGKEFFVGYTSWFGQYYIGVIEPNDDVDYEVNFLVNHHDSSTYYNRSYVECDKSYKFSVYLVTSSSLQVYNDVSNIQKSSNDISNIMYHTSTTMDLSLVMATSDVYWTEKDTTTKTSDKAKALNMPIYKP